MTREICDAWTLELAQYRKDHSAMRTELRLSGLVMLVIVISVTGTGAIAIELIRGIATLI